MVATDARVLLWEARGQLLDDPTWLDYVRTVYRIAGGEGARGHPFLTYVGVNFTKERLKNFKFYFSFFHRLDEAEIADLLPVPNRGQFDRFYAEWHPSTRYDQIHRGTTFALKVGADGALTHYYHVRIPGLPFGPPERLTLEEEDVGNRHGVCEEYTGDEIHLKRYFYCFSPRTIDASLRQAGLSDLRDQVSSVKALEYIESDGRDKYDWISTSHRLIDAVVERSGPPHLASALGRIERTCRFELYGPGSATDGRDHALYFIEASGPASGGGYLFDGVRTFIERYLELPL